jgi:hypothetical protein
MISAFIERRFWTAARSRRFRNASGMRVIMGRNSVALRAIGRSPCDQLVQGTTTRMVSQLKLFQLT